MDATLYHPIFLTVASVLGFFFAFKFATSPDFRYQIERTNVIIPFILCAILAVWLGNRPLSSEFGDTRNYALSYENLGNTERDFEITGWNSEWAWQLLMNICHFLNFDVHLFFIIVEIGYVFSAFWAMKRFVPTNPLIGLLFLLTSLMFFTFGTNGLRNGLACHLVLLAISYFFDERWLVASIIGLLSIGTHASVALPIVAVLVCRYAMHDYKHAVAVWLVALALSATIGSMLSNLALMFSIDDRFSSYLTGEGMYEYKTGFRVDFIIYSLPPILLGWYIIVKKGIKDEWYTTLCSAYCLCNAFWLIIIRAAYSNRFAYLSWFMYPVLIAYPLLNLPIWQDQDKRISIALTAYISFTLIMEIFVWKSF